MSSQGGLPPELLAKILEYPLYDPADFSCALQLEDVLGTAKDIIVAQDEFKQRMFLTSRDFYVTSACVLRRYIVLTSQDDIYKITRELIRGPAVCSADLGAWTLRIDLRISDHYRPSTMNALFKCIPNVKVVVVSNDSMGRASLDRYRPDNLIHSLGKHCTSLQRIQFESVGEEPTVRLLKDLLRNHPTLRTLHFDSAYSPAQGPDDNDEHIPHPHPALSTLSIGSIRRQYHTVTGLDRAGFFLRACLDKDSLPQLRVLHLQKSVPSMFPFLQQYGFQLLELAIGAGDPSFCRYAPVHGHHVQPPHPHVIDMCPNLGTLILIASEWPANEPVRPIEHHAALRCVTVFHVHPEGSIPQGYNGVLQAIRIVSESPFPALSDVHIVSNSAVQAEEPVQDWQHPLARLQARGICVWLTRLDNTQL